MASARLKAYISLNKSEFSKGLSSLKGGLFKLAKVGATAFVALGVGAAAVSGVILKLANDVSTAGDEIQKMALRTGMSTEELSRYKYVAKLTGATLGDVEKSHKRMAATIDDAADGTSTAVRTFRKLGVSLDDLKGKSPDQQFSLLRDKIASIQDPLQQSAMAQEVFGKSGTALLPMMKMTAVEMQNAKIEAEKLGLVFTQSGADASARYQDSLLKVKSGLQGIKTDVALTFLDSLSGMFEQTSGAMGELVVDGKFSTWLIGLGKTTNDVVAFMRLRWNEFKFGIEAIFGTIEAVVTASVGYQYGYMTKGLGELIAYFKNGINELIDYANKIPGIEISKISDNDVSDFVNAGKSMIDAATKAKDSLLSGSLYKELHQQGAERARVILEQQKLVENALNKAEKKADARVAARKKRIDEETKKLDELKGKKREVLKIDREENAAKKAKKATEKKATKTPEKKMMKSNGSSVAADSLRKIGGTMTRTALQIRPGEKQMIKRLGSIERQLVIGNQQTKGGLA